jgi:hypothetical protein
LFIHHFLFFVLVFSSKEETLIFFVVFLFFSKSSVTNNNNKTMSGVDDYSDHELSEFDKIAESMTTTKTPPMLSPKPKRKPKPRRKRFGPAVSDTEASEVERGEDEEEEEEEEGVPSSQQTIPSSEPDDDWMTTEATSSKLSRKRKTTASSKRAPPASQAMLSPIDDSVFGDNSMNVDDDEEEGEGGGRYHPPGSCAPTPPQQQDPHARSFRDRAGTPINPPIFERGDSTMSSMSSLHGADSEECLALYTSIEQKWKAELRNIEQTWEEVIEQGGSTDPMKISRCEALRKLAGCPTAMALETRYREFENHYYGVTKRAFKIFTFAHPNFSGRGGTEFVDNGMEIEEKFRINTHDKFVALVKPFSCIPVYMHEFFGLVNQYLLFKQARKMAAVPRNPNENGYCPGIIAIRNIVRSSGIRSIPIDDGSRKVFKDSGRLVVPYTNDGMSYPYFESAPNQKDVMCRLIEKNVQTANDIYFRKVADPKTLTAIFVQSAVEPDFRTNHVVGFHNGYLEFENVARLITGSLHPSEWSKTTLVEWKDYRDYDYSGKSIRFFHKRDFKLTYKTSHRVDIHRLGSYENLLRVMKYHERLCCNEQGLDPVTLDPVYVDPATGLTALTDPVTMELVSIDPVTLKPTVVQRRRGRRTHQEEDRKIQVDELDTKHVPDNNESSSYDVKSSSAESQSSHSAERKREERMTDVDLHQPAPFLDYMDFLKADRFESVFLTHLPKNFTAEQKKAVLRVVYMYLGRIFFHNNLDGWQKTLILHGTAGAGKSSFLKIIQRMLGEENCHSLGKESQAQFCMGIAKDKKAVVLDEMDALNDGGLTEELFLKLISGESVEATRKFGDAATTKPECVLYFTVNAIPKLKNHCISGDWRKGRWSRRIVFFKFTDALKKTVDGLEEKIFRYEFEALLLKSLLSYAGAILYLNHQARPSNWSLIPNYFIGNAKEWAIETSPLNSFLHDEKWILPDPSQEVPLDKFVKHFQKFLGGIGQSGIVQPNYNSRETYRIIFEHHHDQFKFVEKRSQGSEPNRFIKGLRLVPNDGNRHHHQQQQ